jgi:hypothetical protein
MRCFVFENPLQPGALLKIKPAAPLALARCVLIGLFLTPIVIAQSVEMQPAAASSPATQPAGLTDADDASDSADAYYLRTCAVCRAALGSKGEALDRRYRDRALRFCTSHCCDVFERDKDAGLARLDAEMIADQIPFYPLKVSLIDGRPLGEKPLDFIWGNRLFRAVDAAERDRILADPAEAMRRLDRAVIMAQRPGYGMPDKCPVQGDILPTDRIIDLVVANRMVRVCCIRCARVVRARPYQYLSMVEYANREAAGRRAKEGSAP